MNNLLIFILVSHIFLGILGIVFLTAYLLSFFKKNVSFGFLKRMSFFAFLSFVFSWISGGYYYVTYYGKAVKPVILKGDYFWVHKVLMETKEHIFLFLPFLSLTLFVITFFAGDGLTRDKKLSFATLALCFTTVSVALLVTIFGMVISGAVGK